MSIFDWLFGTKKPNQKKELRSIPPAATRQSDLNAQDSLGFTPLSRAASNTTNEIKSLIAAGANVNARTRDGSTALFFATTSIDCLEALIAAGADVDAKDNLGRTALFLSAA